MSPSGIVARALGAGMGGITLTDHQSARNTPAVAECARRAGLACLYALPKRVNDPDTFGDQPVVTRDDDIVEMEWRILAAACRKPIPDVAAKCRELGGLYIAAHIVRSAFSVYSQLGALPEGVFDAVELSRTADEALWIPKAGGLAATRSSNAHNLDDVARVWSEADLDAFSVASLKDPSPAAPFQFPPD